jgi:septal ring factor EnvC (AmiA/AmiB activator)
VNSDGKLGAQVSSRRFKEDIHPMEEASATLYRLKPVSFRYKKEIDRRGTQQLGLVAEEVEVVNPDLVIRDKEGKPYSVRYDQVNAMLLNEFLKEHQKVEQQAREMQNQEATIVELKSTVAQHQKAMETVTTQLKEQAAQIQKVSGQIEASKAALQVVNNNP